MRIASGGRRRLAIALTIVATVLSFAAPGAYAAEPRGTSIPIGTRPAGVPTTRTVDISRSSAIVEQYTGYWCVPAAVQTMINLATGRSDRSYSTQSRLYTELRRANLYRYSTPGNDVRGWSRVLTARLPAGMGYADQTFTSKGVAFLEIVRAMDKTKRPVGIVVDAASHAWTVVGFKITETPGDPSATVVHGFYVVGPLGSPTDPWPKTYYTASQLATRYTKYHEPTRSVPWEGKYVIVAPLYTTGSVVVSR